MNEVSKLPEGRTEIDLQAAEWVVLRDQGLSPEQQDKFLQWLISDPQHGEWLARHQQTWKDLDLLVFWRPENSGGPNPDLLVKHSASSKLRRAWLSVGLAMAAGLAVVIYWWPSQPVLPLALVTPRGSLTIAKAYESRVLEDGSVIQLKGEAAIEVNYSPTLRHVRLITGEAHFQVAKNPNRPFVVQASGVDVRALGTGFNVKLDPTAVEVLVTEGIVRVDPPVRTGQGVARVPVLVAVGQQTVVGLSPQDAPPLVHTVSGQEMTRLLAWQPKLMDFNSTPLREVVKAFNLRNQVQMVIAEPELGNLPIVASFRSDNAEGFARLLETTSGIRIEHKDGKLILHRSP